MPDVLLQGKRPVSLSVIIPLYNALPYFRNTLSSILDQTSGLSDVEVIIVDDGSTDGSGEFADDVAETCPEVFRVIHIAASGGPARPRNVGLNAARSEYVFFCDSDDYFGPEAFGRMLRHAREWDSDVLLVKMATDSDRSIPQSMFRRDQPSADVYTSNVFNSLGPCKLFRRSCALQHGARFREGAAVREDEPFTATMLLCARTVSVAADYDYYHVVVPDGKTNLTSTVAPSYQRELAVLREHLAILDRHADAARVHAKVLPRVFRAWFSALRALAESPDADPGSAEVEALRSIACSRLTDQSLARFDPMQRLVAEEVMHGDASFALSLIRRCDAEPNGNYKGYPLNRETVKMEHGQAMLDLPGPDGVRSLDVTNRIPALFALQDADVSGDVLRFSLKLVPHPLWRGTLRATLFARNAAAAEEAPLAAVSWDDASDDLAWNVELNPAAAFGAMEQGQSSSLHIRLESPEISRNVRFGYTLGSDILNQLHNRSFASGQPGCYLRALVSPQGYLSFAATAPELNYRIRCAQLLDRALVLEGALQQEPYWDETTVLRFLVRDQESGRETEITAAAPGMLQERWRPWTMTIPVKALFRDGLPPQRRDGKLDAYLQASAKDATAQKRFGSRIPAEQKDQIAGRTVKAGLRRRMQVYFTAKGNLTFKLL